MSEYVSARTEEELEQLYLYMTSIGCKWSSGSELKENAWRVGTAFHIPSILRGHSLRYTSISYKSSSNMTVSDYLRSVGMTGKESISAIEVGDRVRFTNDSTFPSVIGEYGTVVAKDDSNLPYRVELDKEVSHLNTKIWVSAKSIAKVQEVKPYNPDKVTVTIGGITLPDYHVHMQSKETSQIRSNSIAKDALAKLLIEE